MKNINNTVKKKKNYKQMISMGVCVALIAITFILILTNSNIDEVKEALGQVVPISLVVGVMCMIGCVACEGECCRIICNSLGCKLGFGKAFVYSCTDYYFSAVTPSSTGGQPAMAYYMSKDGIPVSKSSISILLTLVQYMGTLVIFGIVAFFLELDFLIKNTFIILMFIIGLLLSIGLVFASLTAMFSQTLVRRIVVWFLNLLNKINIIKNIDKKIESLDRHLDDYKGGAEYVKKHPAISLRIFGICLIQRLLLFMVTYCVYRGLGLEGTSMIDILAMQAIVMLSVTILPLPGSIGAAEGMFLLVFAEVFPAHLLYPAMLLTRGINFYFSMIFAGTITIGNHMIMIRKDKKKAVQ